MLEYDTSWLGKEFDRYSYSVTKEEIVEFHVSHIESRLRGSGRSRMSIAAASRLSQKRL